MHIATAIESWLLDLRAENKSPRTIEWYRHKLRYFAEWLERGDIGAVEHLTADHLKHFLGHVKSGETALDGRRTYRRGRASSLTVHGYAQVVRTFGRWLARRRDSSIVGARTPTCALVQ